MFFDVDGDPVAVVRAKGTIWRDGTPSPFPAMAAVDSLTRTSGRWLDLAAFKAQFLFRVRNGW